MPVDGVQIRPFHENDADEWERYVRSHPSATVFHRLAWSRAVERAYGHRPLHLTAWSGDRLSGVLPLFTVKSLLAGQVLVSVPYATYGGILADDDPLARALLASAEELCRTRGAQYLELRHRDANALELPVFGDYDTFRKPLPARPQDILPSLPRKTRAAARKGLETLEVCFGAQWLDTVYGLYALTMRRLGSPNYRRRLFRELAVEYGDDAVCLIVTHSGKPVAGVISYVFRDEITPYFSGSLEEGMTRNANNVMYLKLMEYAVQRGLKWFDFNRTRRSNHGPHAFKRYHGFEPAPLHYQAYLNKAEALPDLSPGSRRFALAIKVWKRLPLWLTRSAGGRITQWIP